MSEQNVLMIRGPAPEWRVLGWTQVPDRNVRIVLDGAEGAVDVVGRDLFAALQDVRRSLEHSGWIIAVQGSRVDAHPSGMVRDMLGGRRVCVLEMGRHVAPERLVDTRRR